MQQIIILNYTTCTADVYTIDYSTDIEEFIIDELGLDIENVCYMSKPGIIPITIHSDD